MKLGTKRAIRAELAAITNRPPLVHDCGAGSRVKEYDPHCKACVAGIPDVSRFCQFTSCRAAIIPCLKHERRRWSRRLADGLRAFVMAVRR